jgi:hypothetical protein
MSASDEITKAEGKFAVVLAWCGEHKKLCLVVGCVLAGIVLGLWMKG